MNPFEMVVAIIFLVTVGQIIKARIQAKHGIVEDHKGRQRVMRDPDADRLRDEVTALKERIAVLERLATENNSALSLDREIERLR